jgi:hypothetical protein
MRFILLTAMVICMGMTSSYGVQSVYAQGSKTVNSLSDLVGAKAGQAENVVEQRGYTWIKTDKSGGSSYSYWTESGSDRCVTIRTTNGRYESIMYAMDYDCEQDKDTSTKSVSVSASADGRCRLYNQKSDHVKYKGDCRIKQKMSSDENEYDIILGNGDSYQFVESGSRWKVKTPKGWANNMATMTDQGDKATFEWGKWVLTALEE